MTTGRRTLASFVCPRCYGQLGLAGSEYLCVSCGRAVPLRKGIPLFCEDAPYYGEIDQARMVHLLDDAERLGYAKALAKHLADPFVYRYAIDERRAGWIELLTLDHGTRLLEVGCGWGTNTMPLARSAGHVVALDATYERVRFVQIRSAQEGLKNVAPVAASALELPLPSASVDVVAFNGVLEWLGLADETTVPRVLQLRALREARRVLVPGGCLYIGIENRFSLRYLLGEPDDHSFIRFTSLLPRPLANLYLRARTGRKYLTHTHSLRVYRRMLAAAGFSRVRAFWPWPTYRGPSRIVPLEHGAIIGQIEEIRRQEPKASVRKRAYLALLKVLTNIERQGRLCHAFCFIADKRD